MFAFEWWPTELSAQIAWGVMILAFLWAVWHPLLKVFGYSPYSIRQAGGPDKLESDNHGPEFFEKHRELLKLGFQPLGVIQASLGGEFSVEEMVYGNGPNGIMAEIGSVSKSLYFVSSSRQGSAMMTADTLDMEDMLASGYRQKYQPDASVSELFTLHQNEMSSFFGSASEVLPATTIEQAMDVQRGFDTHSCSKQSIRKSARSTVSTVLMLVAIPVAIIAFFTGLNSVWPAIIGMCLAVLLGLGLRMLAQHTFDSDAVTADANA